MEGGPFLMRSVQKQFGRFVEIRIHPDHPDDALRAAAKKFQRERFKSVAIPFYVVLDPTGKTVYWKGAGVMDTSKFVQGLRKAPGQEP